MTQFIAAAGLDVDHVQDVGRGPLPGPAGHGAGARAVTAQHIERTGRGAAPEPGPAAGQQARPPRQLAGLGPHLGRTALLLAALASAP
ncbi:MAG TPA: hypothetical protein PLU79_19300, partial [Burkholderiaceae bacterium]|nr:hypothetical protein [Burkholderiaceae bacterium]